MVCQGYKKPCIHAVKSYSVFGGYRCLVQILHDFQPFGNHTIANHSFKFKSAIEAAESCVEFELNTCS